MRMFKESQAHYLTQQGELFASMGCYQRANECYQEAKEIEAKSEKTTFSKGRLPVVNWKELTEKPKTSFSSSQSEIPGYSIPCPNLLT